ncbi:MAG TPA: hypothetical protein VMJ10_17540 [Kofleriaceae bacterium]|nr:hypothetical protein [Kofleriaceae bacterium]
MNRDAKTQSALVALARTRRMQRALAHAYIHRDKPMPTLRASLGFMTSTARIAGDAGALGHRMSILGVARAERIAYIVEELSAHETPIAYRMWLDGARAGHLVPIHAWYEHGADAAEIRARIAAIATTLEPVARTTTEAWMLSTRIVQRRALRVADGTTPIRKFALQLRVEPTSGVGASGHTTVTAFLNPEATLVEVSALPDAGAIARVTYTGIPSGLGLPKDTVILLTE